MQDCLVKLLLSIIGTSFRNWFQNMKLKNIHKASTPGINLQLCGIFFVTRLKVNADYAVVQEQPVPKNRNILSDQLMQFTGYYTKIQSTQTKSEGENICWYK